VRRFLEDVVRSEEVRFGLLVSTGLVVITGLVRAIVDTSSGRNRLPAPWAGVLVAGAGLAVMSRHTNLPLGVVAGVPLLLAAGLLGRRPWEVMVAALPGAAAIVYLSEFPPADFQPWLVVVVAAAAGMVVDFDRVFRRAAVGPPFLFITMVGVVVTVPDTELPLGLAAAALPVAIAGFPLRMLSLGPGGAAAVGLIGYVAADAGMSRPGAVVGAIGALGLMLAEPIGRWLSRRSPTALQDLAASGVRGVLILGAIHALLVVGLTRFAGLRSEILTAALFAVPFLAVGAILAAAPGRARARRSKVSTSPS
jgi:hypothetical protein